jgi:hypothetical protein
MQVQVNGQSWAFADNVAGLGAIAALAYEWAKRSSNGGSITTPAEFIEWIGREDGTGMTDAQLLILLRRMITYMIKYGEPNAFLGIVQAGNWQGVFSQASEDMSTTIDDDGRSL